MLQQRHDLREERDLVTGLDVVHFVGLPQQQRRRTMGRSVLLRKELRVAGGDDSLTGE